MRRPAPPPPWIELASQPDALSWMPRALAHAALAPGGRYLHWDDLRRRRAPDGLTAAQWWFAVKMARSGAAKGLPLVDTSGVPVWYTLPDAVLEALHDVDQRGAGAIQRREPILNRETRGTYLVRGLVEEAITSSQLEGAATTRAVAQEMLRTGRPPADRGEQMILNNFRTMQRIRGLRGEPLTPALLTDLHALVTDRTLEAGQRGRWRRSDERVEVVDAYEEVLHTPPPAATLDARMEALCRFANGETPEGFVHPVVRAIALHFWLSYDHPFVDGNGRTARALFYWSMLRGGYWLFEYVSISQVILRAPAQYGRAFLLTETDGGDLTYFLLYHLGVIRRALDDLHAYIDRKEREVQDAEPLLRAAGWLNHRQRALLLHALEHPGRTYTIRGHQTSHGVVHQTARTDLLALAEAGLLDKSRRGRRFVFTAPRDLHARLTAGS